VEIRQDPKEGGIQARAEYSADLELVQRMQREADADFDAFMRRTRRLLYGGLAYAFLGFFIVAGLILLLVVLVLQRKRVPVYSFFILGSLLLGIISALFVKREPPEGLTVSREDAPLLWAEVDRFTALAKIPPVARIRIDLDLNAAAATRILPWRFWQPVEHELIVGWSLMSLLDPEEFRSVLAHEFGHFGGRHGHFSSFASRVTGYLHEVATRTSTALFGNLLYGRFFAWFQPRLAARMFVLSRRNEFEADAFEAKFSGPDIAARSLVRLVGQDGRMWHRRLGMIWDWPLGSPAMPTDLATRARLYWQNIRQRPVTEPRLRRLLRVETGPLDTHPQLSDRLRNMQAKRDVGELLALQRTVLPPAVDHYFGTKRDEIEARLSRVFAEQQAEAYARIQPRQLADAQRMQALQAARATRPLTARELEEYGELAVQYHQEPLGIELFRELLALEPDNPRGVLELGQLYAQDEDGPQHAEGLVLLERATQHPSTAADAYQYLSEYAAKRGDTTLARQYEQRRAEAFGTYLTMHVGFIDVVPTDDLGPSALDPDKVKRIREYLSDKSFVAKAYLFTKTDKTGVQPDLDVLLVVPKSTLGVVTIQPGEVYQKLVDIPHGDILTPEVVVKLKPWTARLAEIRATQVK
jgi:Zn-dependent protease with chaperone function